MKKKVLFLAGALVFGALLFGSMANATIMEIPYQEDYNPGTNYLMFAGGDTPYTIHNWRFDITGNEDWLTPGQTFFNGSIELVLI